MATSYEYDFSHKERGVALIICNGQFNCAPTRKAAGSDRKLLEDICRKLGFRVVCLHNLTTVDMERAAVIGMFMTVCMLSSTQVGFAYLQRLLL